MSAAAAVKIAEKYSNIKVEAKCSAVMLHSYCWQRSTGFMVSKRKYSIMMEKKYQYYKVIKCNFFFKCLISFVG